MKKRKVKKFTIYISITAIILAWLALTNFFLIVKYDILPLKYLIPVSIALIVVPGLLSIFMIRKKTKPKIKGVLSAFAILFIILLTTMLFYLNKTFNFISNLGESGYKIENYSVIVLTDSPYEKIEDIKDKNLGYYTPEASTPEEALKKLDEVISVNKNSVEDLDQLIASLYNGENEAIMFEESYRGIVEETNPDFSTKTKVIYTIEIKIKTEDITKNVNVNKDTFNIYISGIDTYGKISSVSRSDVNIIATINPSTHQILLTTIPRDYYVQLDGTTGYKDKLTHAGIYGIEKSIKTIENLLEIEINYYVKVNFSSLEKLINALDGVDVYSQEAFTGFTGTKFSKGLNRVNGEQALEFARTRKTVSGGDRTRGENQQALIQAIINKACSKEIITKYTSILNSLEGSFQTNMKTDEITEIIKRQISEMKPWNITSISLDGSDGREYTYSYKNQKLYVMIPNEETINNAKEKIKQVVNNEVLENSYANSNGKVNIPTGTGSYYYQPPIENIVTEDNNVVNEEPQPEEKVEENIEENNQLAQEEIQDQTQEAQPETGKEENISDKTQEELETPEEPKIPEEPSTGEDENKPEVSSDTNSNNISEEEI